MSQKNLAKLIEAAIFAVKRLDQRIHRVGAIGLRSDGTLVKSKNSPSTQKEPLIHAEARLVQKLDVGSTVWVARLNRSGDLALAKPCIHCEKALKHRGVKRVIYSTGPNSFQVMDLN